MVFKENIKGSVGKICGGGKGYTLVLNNDKQLFNILIISI